ncbi:MAG: hypothetical protein JRI68_10560 [Deltaproteobacteria bacterium]|nr:hypothetical protein [Deltaproteobacteria bacterium]
MSPPTKRRALALTLACAAWVVLPSCGSPATTPATPSAGASAKRGKTTIVDMVTPSRLIPEIDPDEIEPWLSDQGQSKYLLGGLRIIRHAGGKVERSDERFPSGSVKALSLPARLGSGYLFYQSDSQGTRLWRAQEWVGKLTPLAHLGPAAAELVAGFDRLYIRTKSNSLLALDPERGRLLPLGRLPLATGYGAMVFADGWRGIIDTDLRGPMASFDAGASWRPLGITQPVVSAGLRDGDTVLYVAGGYYRLDVRGHLQFVRDEDSHAIQPEPSDGAPARPAKADEHPLGDRPLRVAIERGWPDSKTSAVVAHGGALVRVSLTDGAVVGLRPAALESDETECQGARVGAGFGFICGEPEGDTIIYQFVRPLGLSEWARFSGPRFVAASGNGALVVRGDCEAEPAAESAAADLRNYCIVNVSGDKKPIAVRGELGAERVVALADGRVVVLVPPRLQRSGRLTVIAGDKLESAELTYPDKPRRAVKVARRGMWLEGFEQRSKNTIGGWVEAGGPAVGVTVKLNGEVKLGKVYDEGGQLLVSGRFALATNDTEGGHESTDGGKTWKEFELPGLPDSPGDAKSRGCSPVGCAMRGWLRVGWGDPRTEGDLENVKTPEPLAAHSRTHTPIRLSCALSVRPKSGEDEMLSARSRYSAWTDFRGVPPPKLGKDETGVDKGSQAYEEVPAHVYVWGPKGADWTRAGWWVVRFDDRFDAPSGVRQSARTRPPWSDEVTAAEAIGSRRHSSYWRWNATIDPSGRAALVNVCTHSHCVPYAITEGRPILPLNVPQGSGLFRYQKPVTHGVARVGESWFLLSEQTGGSILSLWRADMGVMRRLVSFRRLDRRRYQNLATPRLARRALGGEIGLLFTMPPDPSTGGHVGQWVVLPVDPVRGQLGAPVTLGPADLDGELPPTCRDDDDGWLLDTRLAVTPAIDMGGLSGYLDDIELRLRLEPGGACVESLAARAGRGLTVSGAGEGASQVGANQTVPLSVRERYTGRRWKLMCGPARPR